MWTHENRPKYNRDHLRYPSDLTDDECAHVEPFVPPAKPGGGKRPTEMRAVMNRVPDTEMSATSLWEPSLDFHKPKPPTITFVERPNIRIGETRSMRKTKIRG